MIPIADLLSQRREDIDSSFIEPLQALEKVYVIQAVVGTKVF